jgi:hypothetical protein
MIHHLKETILTVLPSLGGLYAALEATNVGIKILVGGLTVVYLCIRIAIAWKDYKK